MAKQAMSDGAGALIDRIGRVTRGLQFSDGLSPTQWESLRYVSRANHYSRNPSALAAFLGATKGTVSQTLIALEEKGYLHRVRGNPDRRAVRLELAPAGHELLRRDPRNLVDTAVSGALLPEEASSLVESLVRLLHDLQERCDINAFGICEDCTLFREASGVGDSDPQYHCGLTGEALECDGKRLICVNFRASP